MLIHISQRKCVKRKKEFYSLLETCLEDLPRKYIIIILGDINAKIGKGECFRSTIWMHSLYHTSNYNGCKLIDHVTGRGLKIKSTMFPHKDIHKGIWRSPDGCYTNQIHHVLINARFSNCVLDVRTLWDADCGSDHFLVAGILKVKLKKIENRKENPIGSIWHPKTSWSGTCNQKFWIFWGIFFLTTMYSVFSVFSSNPIRFAVSINFLNCLLSSSWLSASKTMSSDMLCVSHLRKTNFNV